MIETSAIPQRRRELPPPAACARKPQSIEVPPCLPSGPPHLALRQVCRWHCLSIKIHKCRNCERDAPTPRGEERGCSTSRHNAAAAVAAHRNASLPLRPGGGRSRHCAESRACGIRRRRGARLFLPATPVSCTAAAPRHRRQPRAQAGPSARLLVPPPTARSDLHVVQQPHGPEARRHQNHRGAPVERRERLQRRLLHHLPEAGEEASGQRSGLRRAQPLAQSIG